MCMHTQNISGEKLRDLLLKHGDFNEVEVELEKSNSQSSTNDVEGGWENEVTLSKLGWTEPHGSHLSCRPVSCEVPSQGASCHQGCKHAFVRLMIANAKRWALARGLVRTNEVHGLEEFKVPTKESFLFRNKEEQTSKTKGAFVAEDWGWGKLRSNSPLNYNER